MTWWKPAGSWISIPFSVVNFFSRKCFFMKKQAFVDLEEVAAIHASPAKLYHSLGQLIRSKIQSGEWVIGGKIPSERMLMQAFSVSRATVRQAVDILIKEGILYRVQGKGTFAAPPKIKQGVLRLLEFSNIMQRNGFIPSASLLGREIYEPSLDIRRALTLSDGDKAFWYQRLLSVDGMPILIENTYYSATRFPDLLATYDGMEDARIFISRHYGVQVKRESEVFEPVILEAYEANLLGVKQGFPALWVEYIINDLDDTPVVFGSIVLRGDRCRFYIDLTLE